jgi:hypothetical protein
VSELSERESPESRFKQDDNGNPTGGWTQGQGFRIDWQDGVQNANGATVENLIEAVQQRLMFFQAASDGRFACDENAEAHHHLALAISALNRRTMRRKAARTEGTYKGN